MRSIKHIIPAVPVNMGGIILDQALPVNGIEQIDPFLLLHHWSDTLEGGKKPSEVGVGPHPHRGFSPVTFIFKGGVHHRDTLGHSEVVYEGGTQWMNSGSGLIHSERPYTELAEKGGEFEIIQFWINAPSHKKMEAPSYQPLQKEETPHVLSDDGKVLTHVVAGLYNGVKGKIVPHSDVLITRVTMEVDGEVEIPIPTHFNAALYQLDGELIINNATTNNQKGMIWFENDGETIRVKATKETRFILLSGAPINEPVESYGPFVMNNRQELQQAVNDYHAGKMGVLVEDFSG